ncbi:hypothetical protein HII28_18195 [Planctomonas sp. JC2975]|uniref:hypothetical protein n=1 Tax=Planctomonas sp. JC2975 TaxID=2729626 RepID=UPI0014734D7E|nr:hypothetical protein [Planctomonas sp. JC2975]NNC13796.1 hypothetical protein [Planctomonas sp. JC2975]
MLLGAVTGTIGTFLLEGSSTIDIFVMAWIPITPAIAGTTILCFTGGRSRGANFRSAIP